MARRTVVELVDDLTGAPGALTTQFRLDGVDYEIDLVDDTELRDMLAPWIEKGRRVNGSGAAVLRNNNGQYRHDMHRVRQWARANGFAIPSRGKMPRATIEAYDAARIASAAEVNGWS